MAKCATYLVGYAKKWANQSTKKYKQNKSIMETVYCQINQHNMIKLIKKFLRVLGNTKSIVLNAPDDILEENLGRQRVPMIDDRLIVWSVPTIHCRMQQNNKHKNH